jgi:hypothetical protein
MLRAPRPEMVAELNGACSARQSIAQRSNESDAKRQRTPRALCAKCDEKFARSCESSPAMQWAESVVPADFRSAHASSRRFWLFNVLIY